MHKTHGIYLIANNLPHPLAGHDPIRRLWGGVYDPIGRVGMMKWENNPRFATKLFLYQAEFLRDVMYRYMARQAMERSGRRLINTLEVVEFYAEQDEYDLKRVVQAMSPPEATPF